MFQFRPFQSKGINDVAVLAGRGTRKIVFQAPTGAGKTILFCGLVDRFRTRYPTTRIIIAVHRQELLQQTVNALKRVAGIEAALIIAGYTTPVRDINGVMVPFNNAPVLVGMVETLNNRFKKYVNYLGSTGMLIVDECHRGEFNKIYDHFPESLIVGFTATPISANKRIPIKTLFEDIVSPVSIRELISQGFLAKNITIGIKNSINRKTLAVKGNDFDEKKMGNTFSTAKHVHNALKAYEDYSMGQKTIVFNCNVEHSKLVNEAFVNAGYNSRHMDANATEEERREILKWFAETDDAILQNVALYTTGFDEPTVRTVVINRSTKSLPLWLQMCGRGSRSIPGIKNHFQILDLGANVGDLLDWDYPHDWSNYFHNPEKVGASKGNAPTKLCIACEALIHLSTRICPYCGADNGKEPEYDTSQLNLDVLTEGVTRETIEAIIAQNSMYAPYRSLHVIKGRLIKQFRIQYKHRTCSQTVRDILNDRYQILVKEWCLAQDIPYDKKHKWMSRKWLMDDLDVCFGKIGQSSQQSASR